MIRNKLLFWLGILLLSGTIGAAQTPKNVELAAEITRLFEIDQRVQNSLVAAFQNGANKEKMDGLFKLQTETFKAHIPILKQIIRKHGFPAFELVGEEAARNFFTMVQHSDSDLEFQKSYLKKAKKFVRKKQFDARNFAFLTDRVNLNSGKPQIYGTQVTYDQAGKAIPKNLKDAENVNKNRAAVGLEPIEEYLNKMTELHKLQNKKN